MADILEFLPVLQEDANTIRARLDADMNAGLDPADAAFTDTTPGGWYYDLTQGFVLEQERIYDTMGTDVVASMLPQYAWGTYLDEHGVPVDVERNDAAAATGIVTFTGTDGAFVAEGTRVATTQVDPTVDPLEFETTESGMIAGGSVDLAVVAVAPGSRGNVALGEINLLMTPNEEVSAVTNAAPLTGGEDVETDDQYRERVLLEWQAAHGGGTIGDLEKYALDYPGIGHARVIPLAQGPGTAQVIVTDSDNKPSSATVVDGFQQQLDPASAQSQLNGSHTLPDATIAIDDATGFDSAGRVRIGDQIVKYASIAANVLSGCTGGTGTFPDNTPVYNVGHGAGLAPIGMAAIVTTPLATLIDVAATVSFEDGYSLDGSGGTVATEDDIAQAISDYLDRLRPGDDVILNHVRAQIFLVPGVLDVTALTLDDGGGPASANVSIDDGHVAETGLVALT